MNKAAQTMVFFFIMALLQVGNQVYFAEREQAEKALEYRELARESLDLLRKKVVSAELIVERIKTLAAEAGRIENSFFIKTLHPTYKDTIFQSLRYLYIDFFRYYGEEAWQQIRFINMILESEIKVDYLLKPPDLIREPVRKPVGKSEEKPAEPDPALESRLKTSVERINEINSILAGMKGELSIEEIPITRQLLDEKAQHERFIRNEIMRMQEQDLELPEFLKDYSENKTKPLTVPALPQLDAPVQIPEESARNREIKRGELVSYIGKTILLTLTNGRNLKVVLQEVNPGSIKVAEMRPEGEMNYTIPHTRIRLIEREENYFIKE